MPAVFQSIDNPKRVSNLLILLTALAVILVAIVNDDSSASPMNPCGRSPLSNSSPACHVASFSSKAAAYRMSSGMYGEYFAETSCV